MKPVWETRQKEINYTVMKPVWETCQKEIPYTVRRPVWETRQKTINYTVMKPVWEERTRTINYTVMVPVQENRTRTVTTYVRKAVPYTREVTVQSGHWETQQTVIPGSTITRKVQIPGAWTVDPQTGCCCYSPGTCCEITSQCPDKVCTKKVWVPECYTKTINCVKYVCEPCTREVALHRLQDGARMPDQGLHLQGLQDGARMPDQGLHL